MRFQILITSASLAIGKALSAFKENDRFKFSHSNQWQFCCLITLEQSICFGEKRKCGQPTRYFLPFDRTPALAHIYRTLRLRIVAYASCSKISETTVIMRVVEKLRCDPKCHPRSGCSRRGEGKCDFFCNGSYGINPDTYTCMGE